MEAKTILCFEQQKASSIALETTKEENQGTIYDTKSHHSSDLTSLSFNQTEALSQTSESPFISYDIKSSQNMDTNHTLNFFEDVINYFRQTEPEKFEQYKKSKNFRPKKQIEKIEPQNSGNNESNINSPDDNSEDNKTIPIIYVPVDNITYNNMVYGNLIYCVYNNFYLNYAFNLSKNEKVREANEEVKEDKIQKKEEKIEINQKDDIEIINVKKVEKNRNDNRIIQTEKEEREIGYYESNKYRNYKSHKDYCSYDEPYDTYAYNYKGKYRHYNNFNKYNRNFGGRRNNFEENTFYKKKSYQRMYY